MFKSSLATVSAFAVAATLILSAAPAAAQNRYLFGRTDDETPPRATLTFDGITSFVATDTGWITSRGEHLASNTNYLTGFFDSDRYNSWFNFALGAAAPASPYTSAVLRLKTGTSVGTAPFVLSLFDVDATLLQLDAERRPGNAVGQALYSDLGSGVSYGNYSVNAPTMLEQTVTISLNDNFLRRVNAGLVQDFSIGGTLFPQAVEAAVPEPATWAMMILGMGMIGGSMRRRKAKVTTRIAYA